MVHTMCDELILHFTEGSLRARKQREHADQHGKDPIDTTVGQSAPQDNAHQLGHELSPCGLNSSEEKAVHGHGRPANDRPSHSCPPDRATPPNVQEHRVIFFDN
eukprot:gene189-11615_t